MFLYRSIADMRSLGPSRDREMYGAFFASGAVLFLHAQIDWDWQMSAVFILFFIFAGSLLRYGVLSKQPPAGDSEETSAQKKSNPQVKNISRFINWNGLIGVGCVLAMILTFPPLISAAKLENATDILNQAQQLLGNNDSSGAQRKFVELEDSAKFAHLFNPLDAQTLEYEALAKEGQGKFQEAETLISQAMELEPNSSKFQREMAAIYIQTKRPQDAAQAIKRALYLDPYESKDTDKLAMQAYQLGADFTDYDRSKITNGQ